MTTCPNCLKEVVDHLEECPNCRFSFLEDDDEQYEKRKKLLLFCLVILLIMGLPATIALFAFF